MIATRELLTGIVSMLAGALMTYGVSGVKVESRVTAIEKGMARIEAKLDRIDERERK